MNNYKIYKITNLTNNKIYVGFTCKSLEHRFYQHCKYKRKSAITAAINKHGVENFTITCLLDNIETVEEAAKLEVEYIKILDSLHPNGYNLTEGGNYPPNYDKSGENNPMFGKSAWLGRKHSEESKQKMKDSWIIRKQKEEKQ